MKKLIELLHACSSLNHRLWRAAVNNMHADITRRQARLLLFLSHKGEVKMTALADVFGVRGPSLTPMVDKLMDSGYIERGTDAADRRVVTVNLTSKGKSILQRIEQNFSAQVDDLLLFLSNEQKENLLGYIAVFLDIIEKLHGHIKDGEKGV